MKKLALSLLFSTHIAMRLVASSEDPLITNLGPLQLITPNGSNIFAAGTVNLFGDIKIGNSKNDTITIQGDGIILPINDEISPLAIDSNGKMLTVGAAAPAAPFTCGNLNAANSSGQLITLGNPNGYINLTAANIKLIPGQIVPLYLDAIGNITTQGVFTITNLSVPGTTNLSGNTINFGSPTSIITLKAAGLGVGLLAIDINGKLINGTATGGCACVDFTSSGNFQSTGTFTANGPSITLGGAGAGTINLTASTLITKPISGSSPLFINNLGQLTTIGSSGGGCSCVDFTATGNVNLGTSPNSAITFKGSGLSTAGIVSINANGQLSSGTSSAINCATLTATGNINSTGGSISGTSITTTGNLSTTGTGALNIAGNSTLTGTLGVAGLSTLNGGVAIPGTVTSTGTFSATGPSISLGGTTSQITFKGTGLNGTAGYLYIDTLGQLSLQSGGSGSSCNSCTDFSATGNITLGTAGTSIIKLLGNGLSSTGLLSINGTTGQLSSGTSSAISCASLTATGTVAGGNITTAGALSTTGTGALNIAGNSNLTGTLGVTGLSTLTGGTNIPGTLNASGNFNATGTNITLGTNTSAMKLLFNGIGSGGFLEVQSDGTLGIGTPSGGGTSCSGCTTFNAGTITATGLSSLNGGLTANTAGTQIILGNSTGHINFTSTDMQRPSNPGTYYVLTVDNLGNINANATVPAVTCGQVTVANLIANTGITCTGLLTANTGITCTGGTLNCQNLTAGNNTGSTIKLGNQSGAGTIQAYSNLITKASIAGKFNLLTIDNNNNINAAATPAIQCGALTCTNLLLPNGSFTIDTNGNIMTTGNITINTNPGTGVITCGELIAGQNLGDTITLGNDQGATITFLSSNIDSSIPGVSVLGIDGITGTVQTTKAIQASSVTASTGNLALAATTGQINLNGQTGITLKGANIATSGTIPLYITASGLITTTSSSKRYKENITKIALDKNTFDLIEPVTFNYIKDDNKQKQYGYIAEQLIGIKGIEDAVIYGLDGQPETINYQTVFVILSADYLMTKKALIDELKTKNKILMYLENKCVSLENQLTETNKTVTELILKCQLLENAISQLFNYLKNEK